MADKQSENAPKSRKAPAPARATNTFAAALTGRKAAGLATDEAQFLSDEELDALGVEEFANAARLAAIKQRKNPTRVQRFADRIARKVTGQEDPDEQN